MQRHVYTREHLLSLRPRSTSTQPIRIASPPRSPTRSPVRTPPTRTPPTRTPPTSSPPPGFGYRARSPPNVPRIAKGPDPTTNFSRRMDYARNRTRPVVVSSEIDALFEDDFDAFAKRLATHAAHPACFGEIKKLSDVPEVNVSAPLDAVPADALDDNVLEFFDSIKCQALENGVQEEFAFGEPEIDNAVPTENSVVEDIANIDTVSDPMKRERNDPILGDLERWFHALASANASE